MHRNPWARELIYLSGWLGVAALIGLLADAILVCLLVALAMYLLLQMIYQYQLYQWLSTDRLELAVGAGAWQNIYSALYDLKQRDMHRRKRLRRIVAEFNASTEAMPDGAVVLDAGSRIVWCNAAAVDLFGLRPSADRGQRISTLVRHPDFLRLLTSGDKHTAAEIPAPADNTKTVQVRIIAYGAHQSLLIARDISQQKKLEAMRRDFVANASHELRTPLTVLRGYLDVFDQETRHESALAEWHEPVEQMGEQAKRMDMMINDLLCLARLEAEPVAKNREWLDIAGRLQQAVADIPAGGRQIEIACDERLLLHADVSAMDGVINNLISNACRHTPQTGWIRVTWQANDSGAELSVCDNGCGIAPEHIPRLTERFYRIDKGRGSSNGGTGLGLSIVKHALANHQAKLVIRSRPGEGSDFICFFPASIIRDKYQT